MWNQNVFEFLGFSVFQKIFGSLLDVFEVKMHATTDVSASEFTKVQEPRSS